MDTALSTQNQTSLLEQVVINGDLSKLSPEQRVSYYKSVCESVGLNPLTKPFDYITLNGKLTLYARKDATDQLRARDNVSITKLEREVVNDICLVTAYAETPSRRDASTGAVNIKGLAGDALANAMMKAETKAKRRVTLSICGLGMLDETEIETVPAVEITKPTVTYYPPEEPAPAIDVETQSPAPTNGNDHKPTERPMSAVTLRDAIKVKSARYAKTGKICTQGARGLLVGQLEGLFDDAEHADKQSKRYRLTKYLVGQTSMKDITDADANALLDWVQSDAIAAKAEAANVLAADAVEAGQQTILTDLGYETK